MISLHTPVLAGPTQEPATVIGREPIAGGGVFYLVRFTDGRVRKFGAFWVTPAVVRMPVGLRLVVDNGQVVG